MIGEKQQHANYLSNFARRSVGRNFYFAGWQRASSIYFADTFLIPYRPHSHIQRLFNNH